MLQIRVRPRLRHIRTLRALGLGTEGIVADPLRQVRLKAVDLSASTPGRATPKDADDPRRRHEPAQGPPGRLGPRHPSPPGSRPGVAVPRWLAASTPDLPSTSRGRSRRAPGRARYAPRPPRGRLLREARPTGGDAVLPNGRAGVWCRRRDRRRRKPPARRPRPQGASGGSSAASAARPLRRRAAEGRPAHHPQAARAATREAPTRLLRMRSSATSLPQRNTRATRCGLVNLHRATSYTSYIEA